MKRVVVLIAGLLAAPELLACASCLCGDPTLTSMGREKPFAGRLRLSGEYLSREESSEAETLSERRFTLGLSWAASDSWVFGARLPLIERELETASLDRESAQALGDLTLTVKRFPARDESYDPSNLNGWTLSLQLPTAERQRENGVPLNLDVQPGQGAPVLVAGVWQGRYRYPWFNYASLSLRLAGEGDEDFRAGEALLGSLQWQYAGDFKTAWRIGVDARWADSDEYDGVADGNTGGFIAFANLGAGYRIATDTQLDAELQIPAVENLRGDHEEEAVFRLSLTHDL